MMEVDHEDNNGSEIHDIEAQGSSPLLMNDELSKSSLIMRKSAIIFRSTYKFIEAGARIAALSRVSSSSSSSSTTTFYTPLPSFNLKNGDKEAGGDQIQLVEVRLDVNTVQSNNDHVEIELQPHDQSTHQQCLQISEEIVKEKNLDSLHNFDKGIHVGDISGRRKAIDLSRHMRIFTGYGQFMIRHLVCKEPTILLLAIAAILSFVFGIKEEGVQNGWFDGALLVVIIFVIVLFKLARNWYERRLWKKQKDHKARKNYQMLISETDSSFCAYFDKLNTYIHISGLLIGILISVVVFVRFKLGQKDDENGYRMETKEEPAEIARIMNVVKKVLTESKGTVRVLITLLGVTLVGMTEGIPFLISVTMACWYPNFDVKMESVNTICIENVSWLKEPKLKVTQFFLDKKDVTKIPSRVCSVLSDGIGVSTLTSQTACHRVEEPILCWAEKNTGMQRDSLDQQFTIVKDNDNEMSPFEGTRGVVIEKNGDNGKEYYSHFKGPADSILSMCSSYYDLNGEVQDLDDETKRDFAQANNNNVNVVAFACKRTQVVELDENGLTFIGMFVLEDTFNLDNMRQGIAILKEGGVKMIFASEEDVEVLRTIGNEAGLLNSQDALVVKGEDVMKENIEKICITGNSSPAHKLLLLEQLKKRGEVVAVVGEQASESNVVLEAAHFGLPVVTNWPETITYVIDSIKGGRIVCENLRQFIQVEVILAISSLSINFILVILDGDAPLTIIQVVWVNFLVTFIGGPALLITQQSTRQLRDEVSIRPRKPPITKVMWRNIFFQAFYQIGIFVFLQYRGSAILGITPKANRSTVFNGFALCQLFNIFSSRDLEQKNFFKGLGQNYLFWALSGLYLVLQLGFIEVEAVFVFTNTARLNWKQWAESIIIGAVTWLLDVIVKWASQYIKMDKYCDCGVLHLARNWLQYWFMRINCCYCAPRSTPNPTLASLDSSRSTSGKGWITNITRRVKPTKHRANTLMD